MKKITKHSRAFVAIALILCSILTSHKASAFWVDIIHYSITDSTNLTVQVSGFQYGYSRMCIPDTITYEGTTYTVTSIGDRACSSQDYLTYVSIPKTIDSIGVNAFSNCQNLSEIVFEAINCKKMGGPQLDAVFYDCTNVTSITIGANVTNIPDYAFYGGACNGVTELTIPNSVTRIGDYAFCDCYAITSLTIGNSVTSIGVCGFYNALALKELNISDLSAWCKIDFAIGGNPMGNFDSRVLLKLNGLKISNLVIPNDITEIKNYAFEGCYSLTSVTIGNSVTSIGDYAFEGCRGLTSVTIGNSVTEIGDYAFRYCTGVKEIYSLNPTPPTVGTDAFLDVPTSATLYVPAEAYNAYFTTEPWSNFTTIKPLTLVTGISVEAPASCIVGQSTQLNAVVSPNNATVTDVQWSSSDSTVASVDATGLLKYLKEGKTTITVTAGDGSGISHSFEIEVKAIKVSSISLNHDRLRLDVDSTATLTATFAPEKASYKTAEWSVSDSTIVALTDNGDGTATVKQLAKGSAWVIARTTDGTNLADTCEVTTIQLVEAITLDPTAATVSLYESKTITATVEPATADNKDVTWTSSDTSIAVIKEDANGNGVVAMIAEGTVTITATAADGSGITASALVSTYPLVSSITLDKTEASLMIGETATLTYTLEPTDAHNPVVKWRSNNERVATVTDNGDGSATVKAHASGEATVSVFSTDGTNVIADCHVVVGNTFVYNGITYSKTSDTEVSVIAGAEKYAGAIDIPAVAISENMEYNVTAIADSAFFQCDSLTAITLPEGLKTIGERVFYECTKLMNIVVPSSVESIKGYAFSGCSALEAVTLTDGLTEIGKEAFLGCAFSEISIPKTVKVIYRSAFYECANLTEITIPEGITNIIEFTFKNCHKLATVNLPASITTIEKGAFSGCSNITKIYSKAVVPPTVASDFPNYSATLAVPADALEAYKAADYWTNFTNIVGVGELTDGATFVVDGITYKKVAEGQAEVTYGDAAYTGDITIPASVTYANLDYEIVAVGDKAFGDDLEVTSVTLPNTIKIIGLSSFSACRKMTSVNIPNSVTSIGINAFNICESLTEIEIPASVTSIGAKAFNMCYGLEKVTLPNSITAIPASAFAYCRKLESIVIPESVTSIDSLAFGGGQTPLSTIFCKAVMPPTIVKENAFDNYSTTTLYVQPQSVEAYAAAEYWKNFNIKAIPGIALDATEMEMNIGDEMTLTATIDPADITDSQVKWSSSDDAVAMVDDNGKVVALTPGVATITATTADGKTIDGTCVVTVSNIINLTLRNCDAGSFILAAEYGKSVTVNVTTEEGWTINTVTINGEDITSQVEANTLSITTPVLTGNSEIIVVYEESLVGDEAIEINTESTVRVYGYDNTITVKGADDGSVVNVYDTKGVMIYSGIDRRIAIENDGVYIVTVEGRTFKLSL